MGARSNAPPPTFVSADPISPSSALRAHRLSVTLGGARILHAVDLRVRPGEVVALVGPNGAGKSTLLRALAGLLPADGEARLLGRAVGDWSARERGQRLALVRQATDLTAAFTVREVVALGRAPHLGWLAQPSPADRDIVDGALDAMGLRDLAGRQVPTLSGGEQQRTLLAQALAQDPAVLLLDEPTAHLDIRHQLDLLARVRRQSRQGRAVVAALHDLGLAARFADRIAMLSRGRLVADGPPADVLTPALLHDVFGVRAEVAATESGLALRYLLPDA